MITLENIHVCFHQGTVLEKHILKGLDLKVKQGEFVTVIGTNGAGKSTLMNVLSGEIIPCQGKVSINQINVTRLPTTQRAPQIARVFQDPMLGTFADLTIEENMRLAYQREGKPNFGFSLSKALRKKFKLALAQIGIGLENRLTEKVTNLSGGQRQALSLIMATFAPSTLLLLDEHTAALCPKTAHQMMELTDQIIQKNGLTALMITHSMTQALAYGDRTIMLDQGKIVKDFAGSERKQIRATDLIQYFDYV